MASGFPGREFGLGAGGRGGTLLKRTLADMEIQHQQQQMQLQHQHQHQQSLFLRSVKQRTLAAPPSIVTLSPAVVGAFPCNSFSAATQSSVSTSSTVTSAGFAFPRRPELLAGSVPEVRSSGSLRDQLKELERRLLLDDEEEEASASGSAVTHAAWSEAIQSLMSTPQPPVATTTAGHLSPSPTSSSSSTISSSASCSPPSSMPSPPPPPTGTSRQMLLDTATAIGEGNLHAATANLAAIKAAANPRGDAEQRLTAMMYATLFSRLNNLQTGSSHAVAELRSPEHFAATQMLYDLSPCFKLAFIAANHAILEATKDEPNIHILDFEVGHGSQYAAFLHALTQRLRHRPTIRVTAVVDPSSPFTNINSGGLRVVGERIEKLAERVGVGLRFSVVSRRPEELDAVALGCEPGEVLIVNLAFVLSRVADESVSLANPRDEILRRVRALQPRLVTLAEQEINTSTAAFPARFAEACVHYGALLESLEATAAAAAAVQKGVAERARAEAGLARRAVNAVAREGQERVERCEVLGKWRARMGMAGLKPVPLGPSSVEPVKYRLESAGSNPGFTIKEEVGGVALGFGWRGRVLTVLSAWR
ncbi:scarecrow-like protein 8 [Musa acuminata AAA Group]|uniref:scarecrow-like protein 8 n=1 Tax=Musa acuminata AAA Group TaxID=214697 RepID=UPI0031D776A2